MTQLLRSIILVLLVLAAPAHADDFRTTYERGMELFHKKEFAKARSEFLAAYALQAEPTVLFAIAQTYRFEDNFKEAIDWYKKFLADSQAAQDLRAEAQTYLDESQVRQTELDDARRKAAANGPIEANGTPAKMPDGARSPTRIERVARPPSRRIPLGSKIAAGVTGVGLVTSLVLTKVGLGVEQDFEQLGVEATASDADRVERYQTLINVSWGVTAAAAVTTVVLYVVAPRRATDGKQLVVAPQREGGVTVGLVGRF